MSDDPSRPASEKPLHLRIKSPCPLKWSALEGDDRVRFCNECGKHVFNLSAMTRAEALDTVALVRAVCVAFVPKEDGSVRTLNDGSLARPPEPGVHHLPEGTLDPSIQEAFDLLLDDGELMGSVECPEDDDFNDDEP